MTKRVQAELYPGGDYLEKLYQKVRARYAEREWAILPPEYETRAVATLAIAILPYLSPSGFVWEKKARRLVQKAETFNDLFSALCP